MKSIRIASPLYILRNECAADLFGVLRKLADLGFDGVEFLGFFGHSAEEVKAMLTETGLTAVGNHVPYAEFLRDLDGVIGFHKHIGCTYISVADLPVENFAETAVQLARFAEKARANGITLLYHNHDNELIDKIGGQEILSYIMDNTAPDVLSLEPDLGWIEIGGGSCTEYLTKYADRCPVIHLKDYYPSDNSKLGRVREFVPARGTAERGHFEFRPTGYGIVNLPKLMPLCLKCDPDWFVIDHDLAYERDSFDDLKLGLDFTRRLLAIQASVPAE